MNSIWTRHLTDEKDKENFEKQIRNSRAVLERLEQLVDERFKVIDSIETGLEVYKQPGWEGLLAHYNGAKSDLKWFKKLITLDPKEH